MSRAKHTWIIIPTPEKASGKRLEAAGRSSEATVDPGEIHVGPWPGGCSKQVARNVSSAVSRSRQRQQW